MKSKHALRILAALLAVVFTSELQAQSTAFTYQGRLTQNGSPYTGDAEFQPTLWNAESGGGQVAANNPASVIVGVTNGLFMLSLDFGNNFPGAGRWLQLEVRTDIGPYTLLSPRQQITSTPYAIQAVSAMTVASSTGPLELFVNNLRALRLEDNGDSSSDFNTAPDYAPNMIGGSPSNFVAAGVVGATIAGGGAGDFDGLGVFANTLSSDYSSIGGGINNRIATNSLGSTISGGSANEITNASASVIGGGNANTIKSGSSYSTIAGGLINEIGTNSAVSVIGGGGGNKIIGASSIGTPSYSAIAGGRFNEIGVNSTYGAIGGGWENKIADNAQSAMIPGGFSNVVGGSYALAAGRRAKANHTGAFVWADSLNEDFTSLRSNQFRIRANGGVRFDVNNTNWVEFFAKGSVIFPPVALIDTSADAYLSQGGNWVDSSDRDKKEKFEPVDKTHILEQVVALPISTWNYKAESGAVRHIGPVAQDFHASFGVGADDKHIAALDGNGVALAAIQGLNEKLKLRSQNAETSIQELREENAQLRQELQELRRLITNLARKGIQP